MSARPSAAVAVGARARGGRRASSTRSVVTAASTRTVPSCASARASRSATRRSARLAQARRACSSAGHEADEAAALRPSGPSSTYVGTPGTCQRAMSASAGVVLRRSRRPSAWRSRAPRAPRPGSRKVVRSISRHGRHQAAWKSISTGRPAARRAARAPCSENGVQAIATLGLGAEERRPARRRSRADARQPARPAIADRLARDGAEEAEHDAGHRRAAPSTAPARRPVGSSGVDEVQREAEQQEAEEPLHPAEPGAAARQAAQPAGRARASADVRQRPCPSAEREEEREAERAPTAARRRRAAAPRRSARCTARRPRPS